MIMLETSKRIYIHRCLTHANYRASNKRREKDEWWQERREMPSILFLSRARARFRRAFFSDDDVACRIRSLSISMYDFLCFLHTIRQLYASINCQSIEKDRCVEKQERKMINEGAFHIYTRLMSMNVSILRT